MRQVELAERVLLSNSGMSRLLDRVEKAGLVERVMCPGDRRSFHIQLTAEGEEMLERMWPVYARGIAEDFLPALGSNPCEVRETLEAVGRQCDAAKAAEVCRRRLVRQAVHEVDELLRVRDGRAVAEEDELRLEKAELAR